MTIGLFDGIYVLMGMAFIAAGVALALMYWWLTVDTSGQAA